MEQNRTPTGQVENKGFIIVLDDGDTWSSLEGSKIVSISNSDIDEAIYKQNYETVREWGTEGFIVEDLELQFPEKSELFVVLDDEETYSALKNVSVYAWTLPNEQNINMVDFLDDIEEEGTLDLRCQWDHISDFIVEKPALDVPKRQQRMGM